MFHGASVPGTDHELPAIGNQPVTGQQVLLAPESKCDGWTLCMRAFAYAAFLLQTKNHDFFHSLSLVFYYGRDLAIIIKKYALNDV